MGAESSLSLHENYFFYYILNGVCAYGFLFCSCRPRHRIWTHLSRFFFFTQWRVLLMSTEPLRKRDIANQNTEKLFDPAPIKDKAKIKTVKAH